MTREMFRHILLKELRKVLGREEWSLRKQEVPRKVSLGIVFTMVRKPSDLSKPYTIDDICDEVKLITLNLHFYYPTFTTYIKGKVTPEFNSEFHRYLVEEFEEAIRWSVRNAPREPKSGLDNFYRELLDALRDRMIFIEEYREGGLHLRYNPKAGKIKEVNSSIEMDHTPYMENYLQNIPDFERLVGSGCKFETPVVTVMYLMREMWEEAVSGEQTGHIPTLEEWLERTKKPTQRR